MFKTFSRKESQSSRVKISYEIKKIRQPFILLQNLVKRMIK